MGVAGFSNEDTMENTRIHVGQSMSDKGVFAGKASRTTKVNATTKGRAKCVKRDERGHRRESDAHLR